METWSPGPAAEGRRGSETPGRPEAAAAPASWAPVFPASGFPSWALGPPPIHAGGRGRGRSAARAVPASREPPRRGRRGLCPEPRPPSVTMRSWGAGGGEAAPERRPGPRAARGLGRRRCGPTRDPCRSPHPPPPPRPVCRATQRRGGDSRALHLVAIQFHAAAGLLRPRADVRAGELLFILSSLSRLLPWEGSGAGGGGRRARMWRRQRRGRPRPRLCSSPAPGSVQTWLCPGSGAPWVGAALDADSAEAPPD